MYNMAMAIVAFFGVALVVTNTGWAQLESADGIHVTGYAIIELKPASR